MQGRAGRWRRGGPLEGTNACRVDTEEDKMSTKSLDAVIRLNAIRALICKSARNLSDSPTPGELASLRELLVAEALVLKETR